MTDLDGIHNFRSYLLDGDGGGESLSWDSL